MAVCFTFSGLHDILITEVERFSKRKRFSIRERFSERGDYEHRGFWKEDIDPETEC